MRMKLCTPFSTATIAGAAIEVQLQLSINLTIVYLMQILLD